MKGPEGLRKNVGNIDDRTTKVLHKSLIIYNLEYPTTLSYEFIKPTVITSKMRPSRNRPVNHIRTIG